MNFKQHESLQKLRGGYYTPPDLAVFISRWVSGCRPHRILEPSCGDGVFFEALASSLQIPTTSPTTQYQQPDSGAVRGAHEQRHDLR